MKFNHPLEFIKYYDEHKKEFLPMDETYKKIRDKKDEEGIYNIGWNAGLIDGNLPFFAECWAGGFTAYTVYIYGKNLENYKREYIDCLMAKNNVYKKKDNAPDTKITPFIDEEGRLFLAITVLIGENGSEETFVLPNTCMVFPYSILNDYNKEKNGK